MALALETGSATFATDDPYCAYVVSGPDGLYDEIFEAWRRSPYEGEIRPVFISVEGEIKPNTRPELAPFFRVRTAHEISVNFSDSQARHAFDLRAGMPLPGPRQVPGDIPPQERLTLTD